MSRKKVVDICAEKLGPHFKSFIKSKEAEIYRIAPNLNRGLVLDLLDYEINEFFRRLKVRVILETQNIRKR